MPQAATANMGLLEPTEDGDADVWDTLLTAVFSKLDAHDHTAGKGARIPSAALNVNADVSWSSAGTNYSIIDLKAIDFAPVAAASVAALASALFVNSDDANNLYFRNQAGTNVKIIDGNTLNVSIVGGIGGDYSSIGALLDYDDATDTYRFRQQTSAAVRQYAKIKSGDISLFEYIAAGNAVVPANSITMKSPAGLAAAYTITLPSALPASTLPLLMSAAGVLSFPTTDITLPNNAHVILSGLGRYKHGTFQVSQSIKADYTSSGAVSVGVSGSGITSLALAGVSAVFYCVLAPLPVGKRVTSVTLLGNYESGAAAVTYDLMRYNSTTGTLVSVLAAPVVSTNNAPAAVTLTPTGGGYTPAPNDAVWLKISVPGTVTMAYLTATQNFDHP